MTTATPSITGGQAAGRLDEADRAERKAIAYAAREFEAMFLLQMLKQMRQSMLQDEDEEPGLGSATMVDTIDSELARTLAGHGGLARVLADSFGGPGARPLPSGLGAMTAVDAMTAAPAGIPTPPTVAAPSLTMIDGPVSSRYGWRQDPLNGAERFHKGVDIRAAYGREVPAAAAGVVVSAGTAGGYGETVLIDHGNGLRTRYAHLSVIGVSAGDSVSVGQIVGRVGQTGRATGPHLHFEVLQDGKAMDPSLAAFKIPVGGADYPNGPARAGTTAPGDSHED